MVIEASREEKGKEAISGRQYDHNNVGVLDAEILIEGGWSCQLSPSAFANMKAS